MKVVIQCAGQKQKRDGRLRDPHGVEVLFIARPDLCPPHVEAAVRYVHPDDPVGPGIGTWREALVTYNRSRENPCKLSRAAELYRPKVYQKLASTFGCANVFVLSAGWGMIRSDFLTPDYNITFSNQADAWAKRSKRLTLPLLDLNHLAGMTLPNEPVHFFGGRDYLPLFRELMKGTAANVTVHHKGNPPMYQEYAYKRHTGTKNQNWHYEAAEAFIQSDSTIHRD